MANPWAPISQELQKVASFIADPTKDIPENQGDLILGEVSTVDYVNATVTAKIEGRTEVVGPFAYDPALAVVAGGMMFFARIGNSLYGISYRGAHWVDWGTNGGPSQSAANTIITPVTYSRNEYMVANRVCTFNFAYILGAAPASITAGQIIKVKLPFDHLTGAATLAHGVCLLFNNAVGAGAGWRYNALAEVAAEASLVQFGENQGTGGVMTALNGESLQVSDQLRGIITFRIA